MSFLYPRVVSIRRPNVAAAVGALPFGGAQPANETVIATSLPASIQYDRKGTPPRADLPTDTRGSTWKIIIPKSAIALGAIVKDDIVVDDLGNRYQVEAPYWNSFGYGLRAELLAV